MSHISTAGLGLIAAALAFGGVQFGMASDNGLARGVAGWRQTVIGDVGSTVNRSAKADRGALMPAPTNTVTLSFRLRELNDTSIAMRLPTADALRLRHSVNGGAAPDRTIKDNNSTNKPMIACEPVVSPLTDIAKQLGPGRCLA
jgi:hypothetical protein